MRDEVSIPGHVASFVFNPSLEACFFGVRDYLINLDHAVQHGHPTSRPYSRLGWIYCFVI